MKTVIVHLSDAHFELKDNFLDKKGNLIARAVQTATASADACFIVFTGDIAFSGVADEYNKGFAFLNDIRNQLRQFKQDLIVEFVVVPGNHDLDFNNTNALRTLSLRNAEALLSELDRSDTSIVNAITIVQNNFFHFLSNLEFSAKANNGEAIDSGVEQESGYNRLCYVRNFEIKGLKFNFNCYNTAWVSKIREQQGSLIFPEFVQPSPNESDLVFSLFHHPYNWLESSNASKFKKQIEPISNFVLTGHEHESAQYTKSSIFSGNRNLYIAAPVLQDGKTSDSSFNIIELDNAQSRFRITEFSFSDSKDIYLEERKSTWLPIEKGINKSQGIFEIDESFSNELNDIGVYIKHPSQANLTLDDIFICPDLEILSLQKNEEATSSLFFESEQVFDYLTASEFNIVITGQDTSGRTTFAKSLFKHFKKNKLLPLLIQGTSLNNTFEDEFLKTIKRAISEQYGTHLVDDYFQQDINKKILIIDDFQKSIRLNQAAKKIVLDLASKHFSKIIVFADDLFRFEEITQSAENENFLLTFSQAEIKPFGQRLRRKLISKWFQIGRDYSVEQEQIDRRIEETANIVTTLLGRKMIPSYPIFILSMLQVLEAGKDLNTAPTNFGYFYEVFIINSLNDFRTSSLPLDVLTTFITSLAQRMFELRRKYITEIELDQVFDEYHERHAFKIKHEQMIGILVSAKILHIDANQNYRFKYRMGFYYFVAKHHANNINSPSKEEDIRRNLIKMANNLYVEDYANIIIFFVYLTQDERTITQILHNAKRLYEEVKPCNLDSDIQFINQFKVTPLRLRLNGNDPSQNKEKELRAIDEMERQIPVEEPEEDYEIEKELNDVLRLNVAFKTLQIIGQILRNFPGRLEREQKLSLVQESYDLGLRSLQMMFSTIERYLPELREMLTEYAQENMEIKDETRLSRSVDKMFFVLMVVIVYGMIKRISNTIGTVHLKETYEEILKNNSAIPIKLIDTLIRLDHFAPFPEDKINELNELVKNNLLCSTVERKMVADHFDMIRENYKLRQRVCDKLGIQFNDERVIGSKHKM